MAKRVDPAKAKAAKQKKIAIGGMLVLVAVLAIQGPKTLKMLKGPQPDPLPAAVTPAPAAGTPTAAPATGIPPAGAPAAAPAAPAAELASVPDSDQAPVVSDGQLETFERFASKDPFAQQAEAVATPAQPSKPANADNEAKPTNAVDPAAGGGTAADPTVGGFTTGTPSAPPAASPAAPELASATSLAINGVAEDVTPEQPFPADEPTFVLVSVAADGKSVEIGVNGGEYANGGDTLKLALGKKVTLQNTADGSRYELELLSIQGFPLPKRKG